MIIATVFDSVSMLTGIYTIYLSYILTCFITLTRTYLIHTNIKKYP